MVETKMEYSTMEIHGLVKNWSEVYECEFDKTTRCRDGELDGVKVQAKYDWRGISITTEAGFNKFLMDIEVYPKDNKAIVVAEKYDLDLI